MVSEKMPNTAGDSHKEAHSPIAIYQHGGDFILRTADIGDAERIVRYYQDNREHLMPFEPNRDAAFYQVNTWLKKLMKLSELHRLGLAYYCLLIDADTDKMLGTLSFSHITRFPLHACQVGYSLAFEAQGKGYMRRALTLGCDYMFHTQNMHRIQAAYMPHNQKSAAVLHSVGFKKEGYAKDYLLINGQWQDHVLTSLIHPNWPHTS